MPSRPIGLVAPSRLSVLALLLIALLCGSVGATESPAGETAEGTATGPTLPLPDGDGWIEMRTPHFTLFGDAGKRRLRDAGRELEALRSVLQQTTSDPIATPVPLSVFVFRTTGPYLYFDLDGEASLEVFGSDFARVPHAAFLTFDASAKVGGILPFSYTRCFLADDSPWVPTWFEIGLASYYATFEALDDYAYVGKVNKRYVKRLRALGPTDLVAVLDGTFESPARFGGQREDHFAAQSWALVHYLLIGNRDRGPHLLRYLELQRMLPQDQALRQAFGTEPEALAQEVFDYVNEKLHDHVKVGLPEIDDDFPVRTLPRAEVLARLGELLAIQDRATDAEHHLRTALEIDSTQPRAHVGLGLLAERDGRFDDAADHYARADAASPDDAGIDYLRARAAIGRANLSPGAEALRQVVLANPRYRDAWELLAEAVQQADTPPEDAATIYLQVLGMNLDREDIARSLHALYLARGETDEARRMEAGYFAPRGLSPNAD